MTVLTLTRMLFLNTFIVRNSILSLFVAFRHRKFLFLFNLPIQIIWSALKQTIHILKDDPKIELQFYTSLFVKSTDPTNIFKLGVKRTGPSASVVLSFLFWWYDHLVVLIFTINPAISTMECPKHFFEIKKMKNTFPQVYKNKMCNCPSLFTFLTQNGN